MSTIKILDCTLRDGGYVNNWEFGEKTISLIAKKLCESSVEYIECGFLSQTHNRIADQSIFSTIESANQLFSECSQKVALMINCGEYAAADISEYSGGVVSMLRVAFHKPQEEEAKRLCVVLKEKGYEVFVQPMVTIGYTDKELLSLIDWANRTMPDAFYMVDSFGTMRKSDLLRMFYLIDNNLDPRIKIGFHSHNNLQLSFSNAQELILMHSKRELIIDSSVFGMGRGAGNLCTELLTRYINENIENKYDIIPILEIMDDYIMPIYSCKPWGYSAPYYIAAVNSSHPNYATYLMNKQTLCIRDINSIIKSIPANKKHLYDEQLIGRLYFEYQQNNIDDRKTIKRLSELCSKRKILILAPGQSLLTHENIINEYIRKNSPVVFAINHIPDMYHFDIVFVSNLKRFRGLGDDVKKMGDRLICTSNINVDGDISLVNYSEYLNDSDTISDNAGLMLINILRKAGISEVALAGFDGFTSIGSKDYFDDRLKLDVQYKNREEINCAMNTYFKKLRRSIQVEFITPTIFDE